MKCLSVAKHIKQVQIAENSPKLLKKKKRAEVMVGDADGTVAEGEEVVNPKGQWSPGNVDVGTAEGSSTKNMSEFVSEDRGEITAASCVFADTWPRD